MVRAIIQSARLALRTATPRVAHIRPALVTSFLPSSSTSRRPAAISITSTPVLAGIRGYASGSGLGKPEVEGRIVDLLKGFDKIKDTSKISQASHFANDLGLDSLDTVEVVMAIEEEFSIEIPDKDADAIHSVDKAVEYILAQPDAH